MLETDEKSEGNNHSKMVLAQHFFCLSKPYIMTSYAQDRTSHPRQEGGKTRDRSLQQVPNQAGDTAAMSNRSTCVDSECLTQSAAQDGAVAPEFGDAADPASEELGLSHRDE